MSKELQTHIVVTAHGYGQYRQGQVVPVANLEGEHWKNYLNDGIRYATEEEAEKEFVTITPNKNSPASVEIELAQAKHALRQRQERIDRLELELSRKANDQAQAESPSLLAGKDKQIKELQQSFGQAQIKISQQGAEIAELKKQLEAKLQTTPSTESESEGGGSGSGSETPPANPTGPTNPDAGKPGKGKK